MITFRRSSGERVRQGHASSGMQRSRMEGVPESGAGPAGRTDDLTDRLRADPLPWLLDADTPAVRAAALTRLLDRPHDDPEVVRRGGRRWHATRSARSWTSQEPEGYWEKAGPGYSPSTGRRSGR